MCEDILEYVCEKFQYGEALSSTMRADRIDFQEYFWNNTHASLISDNIRSQFELFDKEHAHKNGDKFDYSRSIMETEKVISRDKGTHSCVLLAHHIC